MDISPFVTGAAQPKLSKTNLETVPILLPEDKDEQKAIAAVLGSLDDKIELLREQNETLEALAQTLFKHWFIDFNLVLRYFLWKITESNVLLFCCSDGALSPCLSEDAKNTATERRGYNG